MRARDLGITIGRETPGPRNAITDVAGVTEEAIVSVLVAATTVVGGDGITAHALPHDRLREVVAAHGR